MKVKLTIILLLTLNFIIKAQQIEVLYTLDYKASEIIPSNGYHVIIAEDETTQNGIFDIYDQNGNFIATKNFLKGNYTSDPSVYMLGALVNSSENSIASGIIDSDTNGYWTSLRLYDSGINPISEKTVYNAECYPYLINGVYYGKFFLRDTYDLLNSNWNFPYTGADIEWFIAPLNNDLSLGNWVTPLTDLHPNASSIENIQATPDGNLMVSIIGDFSPPLDRSSLAIKIDANTGAVLGELAPAGFTGLYDFHKYDYETGDLYVYYDDTWTIAKIDANGNVVNETDWPVPIRLFGNWLTSVYFTDNEVVGVNLWEYGQTTRLSKDLILGYTTPSFQFNYNFLINSGWVQNDGIHIIPVAYTGDGMQVGTSSLPNITNWNTVICRMFNPEDLSLRGILNDEDENVVATFDHQIYDGVGWIPGYYQSTLVFKDGTAPDVGDLVDENWVIPAPEMEIYMDSNEIEEITRNGETFKRFWVWFKITGATGVQFVENALEVIIKEAEEVGIGINENLLSLKTKLYPNPADNFVQLEIPVNEALVEIYNTLGQHVATYKWDIENKIINLTHLKQGTYYLRIKTSNDFAYKKLIKE